jgi:predicted DNA-binding antitoxin AbrB/MazE fold protein
MTVQIMAHFENGVFVPDEMVNLPEHQRVTVHVEDGKKRDVAVRSFDDPNDPRPAGGPELVDWWARHRIVIDPETAREIAENPEFNIENS